MEPDVYRHGLNFGRRRVLLRRKSRRQSVGKWPRECCRRWMERVPYSIGIISLADKEATDSEK
jgi:hypothetical protein